MNVQMIKNAAIRGTLLGKKYLPEILLTTGIVSGIGCVFAASKASYHVHELNDETKKLIGDIKNAHDNNPEYTEDFYKQDMAHAYIETALKYLKLYGPAIGLGAVSLFSILGSHGIMSRRYASLAAAYEVVSEGFKKYRVRVAEQLGEEKEKELRFKEDETKGETAVDQKDLFETSEYARWFDETNVHWQTDNTHNLYFLQLQQTYANHLLNSNGHIFLNEVYDCLGLPRTQAGAVVGWVKGHGDNAVNFNMYTPSTPGPDKRILLDFNVDGIIWNKI